MKCKKFKEKIIFYLYGELDKKERSELENHIKECSACSRDFEYTKKVFQFLEERQEEETHEGNWGKCWQRINATLPEIHRRRKILLHFPKWIYVSGVLLVVLVLGVFTGRHLFSPHQKSLLQPAASQNYNRLMLQKHLENVKPMLIEYANYTSEKEQGSIVMDKEVARNLLIQNLLLKKTIVKTNPFVAQLMDDVDIFLKEIANLQKEDKQTPFLIKELIHQRDIPLKMEIFQKFNGG